MNNGNIIDFVLYQEKSSEPTGRNNMLSEDLRVAIEILIQRLRDNNPLMPTRSSKLTQI
jgi:hypothetical protein